MTQELLPNHCIKTSKHSTVAPYSNYSPVIHSLEHLLVLLLPIPDHAHASTRT